VRGDFHKRIIVGAAVMLEAERDPAFVDRLRRLLSETVIRSRDREVIADLLAGA
jgi:hypothetical protein